MSDKERDGGPAFPVGSDLGPASNIVDGGYGGMSLRDYFAGQAMQAMLPHWAGMEFDEAFGRPEDINGGGVYRLVLSSYQIADAMLAKREKTKPAA